MCLISKRSFRLKTHESRECRKSLFSVGMGEIKVAPNVSKTGRKENVPACTNEHGEG